MNLKTIREQIDQVDEQLVELLETRIQLVLSARPYKKTIEDQSREQEIIDQALSKTNLLSEEHIREIFESCFKESKKHLHKSDQALTDQE